MTGRVLVAHTAVEKATGLFTLDTGQTLPRATLLCTAEARAKQHAP